jgi:hypothetical protein
VSVVGRTKLTPKHHPPPQIQVNPLVVSRLENLVSLLSRVCVLASDLTEKSNTSRQLQCYKILDWWLLARRTSKSSGCGTEELRSCNLSMIYIYIATCRYPLCGRRHFMLEQPPHPPSRPSLQPLYDILYIYIYIATCRYPLFFGLDVPSCIVVSSLAGGRRHDVMLEQPPHPPLLPLLH